jgi:hypothetical protein
MLKLFENAEWEPNTLYCQSGSNLVLLALNNRIFENYLNTLFTEQLSQNAQRLCRSAFPNLKYLRIPFGISDLSAYPIFQEYQNQLARKRSNHTVIEL